MPHITINGNTFDPFLAEDGSLLHSDASKSDFILLRCQHYLTGEEQEQLAKLQVEVHRIVDAATYLCRYRLADLDTLRNLPYVEHVAIYESAFVQTERVAKLAADNADEENSLIHITVNLHDGIHENGLDLFREIQNITSVELFDFNDSQLRVKVPVQSLETIAKIDCVRTIEETGKIKERVSKSLTIFYPKLTIPTTTNKRIFFGEGQVIGIADSGFDVSPGKKDIYHPAFKDRVLAVVDARRAREGETLDPDLSKHSEHGTHVAGCALGYLPTPFKWFFLAENDPFHIQSLESPAPKAKLYFQVVDPAGSIPPDMISLLAVKDKGVFIHSNSWGTDNFAKDRVQRPYAEKSALRIDEAMFNNPELLVVWAAGNDGVRTNTNSLYRQVGEEGASKNAIVVGATFNRRWMRIIEPDDRADPDTCIDHLISDKSTEKGAMGIKTEVADFSSKGPTIEGRIKPDVVAPGCGILSARTRTQKIPDDPDYPLNGTKNMVFSQGTSQAAPLVAGCAAVLREAFMKYHAMTKIPSGSLLKAILVNGAVDLRGTDWYFSALGKNGSITSYSKMTMPPAPNAVQGFGLVNLERSIACIPFAQDIDLPVNSVTPRTVEVLLPQPPKVDLQVTLAYTDTPGAIIQDVLDLWIEYEVNGEAQYKYPDPVQYMPYQKPGKTIDPMQIELPDLDGDDSSNNQPSDQSGLVEATPTDYTHNNVQKITWKQVSEIDNNRIFLKIGARRLLNRTKETQSNKFSICFLWTAP